MVRCVVLRLIVLSVIANLSSASHAQPAILPRHWALVVGVNKYIISSIDELRFAERDARKLDEELERTSKFIVHP